MTFRPTTAQLRSLLLTTSASGFIAAILVHEHLAGHDANGLILGFGVSASSAMLLVAGVAVAYSRAVTECTEAGIRIRGLGLERRWRWSQISEVSIRIGSRGITRTVMLTLTGGAQVVLGAPVTGGLMQDRDFDRKVREIHQFWRHATGWDSAEVPIPVVPPTSYRVTTRSTTVGLITLAALVMTAVLPIAIREGGSALLVRLGQGQPGFFTGYFYSCTQSCRWVGDFTSSATPVRRDTVTIAPGASIPMIGGRVPAVNTGSAGLVYPAGGGSGWIPLAITLALLAGCLVVIAIWLLSRLRQQTAERESQLGSDLQAPAGAAGGLARPVRPRRPAAERTAVITTVPCLVVGGVAAAVLFLPIPSPTPSADTRACADYGEWLAAYERAGVPWSGEAALARATQVKARAALGSDLAALDSDVTAAAQLGQSLAGDDALGRVTIDMQVLGHDCSG